MAGSEHTTSQRPAHRSTAVRQPGAWGRFTAALVIAVGAFVGIPALLIACATATLDRPHPIPAIGSRDDISEYFERGLTATEIVPIAVRVLLVVAWLLWAALALSIIGSVVEASTGNRRRWPHVRMFAGLSRWIAAGLTAVSSLSANFVSAGAMPSPLPFTISAVHTDTGVPAPVERAIPTGHARVLPGESAETFALRTLGDAARWTDIWELNQNQPVGPGGETWSAAWKLSAGWDLRLPFGSGTATPDTADPARRASPAAVAEEAGVPAAPGADAAAETAAAAAPQNDGAADPVEQYRVQPGDSYWSIAEGRLGPGASGSAVAAYTEALMVHNAPRLGYETPALLLPGDLVSLVAPPAAVVVGESTSANPSAADRAERSGAAPSAGDQVYVVQAGDSYWQIAELRAVQLHGQDGAHGSVVYELMLDLIDLNAPRLGYDDREMLHPGDEVWLFDPAQASPASDGVVLAPGVVEAASTVVATATAAADAAAAAADASAEDHTTSADVPETAADEEPAPPSTIEAPPSTDVPLVAGSGEGPTGAEESPRRSSPSPIGLGEAALIATGIIALIAARRRARLRSAEPPARIPLPSASASAAERELRRVSSADRLLRVDIAVRAAAATMADMAGQIVAVYSAPDGTIELVASAAVDLPSPWSGADTCWVLAGDVAVDDLAPAARTVGVPCVALTEIGVDEQGRDVLVDLEALGVLAIDADRATADDIVRAVTSSLASSEFAEVAHLVGVGVDEAAFLGHRHAQSVGTVDEAVELATTLVGPTGSASRSTFALRSRRTGGESWEPAVVLVGASDAAELTPSVLRHVTSRRGVAVAVAGPVVGATWTLRPAGDAWQLDPLGIRLRPVGLDRASLDDIVEAVTVAPTSAVDFAPPASALAIDEAAMAGPSGQRVHDLLGAAPSDPSDHVPSDHVLVVDVPVADSEFVVSPISFADPIHDSRSEVARINGITVDMPGNSHVNGHRHINGHGPIDAGVATPGSEPPSPPAPGAARGPQPVDPAMVVRLLGPVELTDASGSAARFERSKTLELLAWIVTHRDRATRSGARTALWDLDVRDATFANVVSEARRVMGRHVDPPEGDEWLRRTMTDELSLHEHVVADVDIVRSAMLAARGRPETEAMSLLRPAVELVRGMPFAGTSYLWPDVEGLTSNLVLLTTSVTAEYARLALDAGDVDGVFWATGQGLDVLPGQESLIALRMRAHAQQGDLSGVRVEWEAYERVLNADPWSDGEPAEKLVALRRELLSK